MLIRITFLGTGAGMPGKDRYLPAILVEDGLRKILLDAGEGVQYRLFEIGVSPLKITHIFITHLHGDHVFGLPGLLATMAMLGRKEDLVISGPSGIVNFVKSSMEIVGDPPFHVRIYEIEPSIGIKDVINEENFSLQCTLAKHTVPDCAYSLNWRTYVGRFNPERAKELGVPITLWKRLHMGETVVLNDGRVIKPEDVVEIRSSGLVKVVYTGDTAPADSVVEISRGAQVLIHDSTFSMIEDGNLIWNQGHSRSVDAARVAKEAGVERLVLTHISNRYSDPELLAAEASEVFPNVIAARDLMSLMITS
ncbi:ribonuclease Z [Vulcanisaeta distributa]|uniref:Ribonuclease Z n=1 Tax=Vulcanisaeta distributa (strain DSM 14429 / JCM 11212 / NBRC 100878 / IC-017) TaxID=572478 RepID=E1QRL0_VULDI|nr:ribonuclease Z [Vulcanisaeta distributa]ADN51824.1 ribonuclease Z [Vulcanisaeta distributa DSM 14429]